MLAMYLGGIHRGCWRCSMSVTQIDLDDEALAEAMRLMGV
ncbi:type II toxin-antitoxin system VapB family antitoxin, partial [Streptomyces fulvoviolaceus]